MAKNVYKLYITGDISLDAYVAFSSALDEIPNAPRIDIELSSSGGDVHAALAFSAKIKSLKAKVHIHATGEVASAATLILASGDRRTMASNAWVMVHEEQLELTGSLSQVEREVLQFRKLENQWNALMAKYTKFSTGVWAALNKETSYLNAQDCLEFGLIDAIINEGDK